jgi:hypothetical protein
MIVASESNSMRAQVEQMVWQPEEDMEGAEDDSDAPTTEEGMSTPLCHQCCLSYSLFPESEGEGSEGEGSEYGVTPNTRKSAVAGKKTVLAQSNGEVEDGPTRTSTLSSGR